MKILFVWFDAVNPWKHHYWCNIFDDSKCVNIWRNECHYLLNSGNYNNAKFGVTLRQSNANNEFTNAKVRKKNSRGNL